MNFSVKLADPALCEPKNGERKILKKLKSRIELITKHIAKEFKLL